MAPRSSTSLLAKARQPEPAPPMRAASCSTLYRRLLGPIGVVGSPLPLVKCDRVLAHALVRFSIKNAQPQPADVNRNSAAGIARRR